MEKFGKSQPVKRVEDVRFLTGHGRYVDDIAPENALYGFVYRAPVAHATITGLDVSDARAAEGVRAVLTSNDLKGAGITGSMSASTVKNLDGSDGAAPRRPLLAEDKVRFVGEPVAFIVAETLDQARDAAEMIELDYDDLPAKMDIAAGGPSRIDYVADFGLDVTPAAMDAIAVGGFDEDVIGFVEFRRVAHDGPVGPPDVARKENASPPSVFSGFDQDAGGTEDMSCIEKCRAQPGRDIDWFAIARPPTETIVSLPSRSDIT